MDKIYGSYSMKDFKDLIQKTKSILMKNPEVDTAEYFFELCRQIDKSEICMYCTLEL